MAAIADRPLIGITGGRIPSRLIPGVPEGTAHIPIDICISAYSESVARAGGVPVHVTRGSGATELLDRLDGLVLAGGSDIDPRHYGSAPGPGSTALDPERDDHEIRLTLTAMAMGLPLLGICRGMQVMNVALGGTLVPHLAPDAGEAHSFTGYPADHPAHRVAFVPGSQLYEIFGEETRVNSFHHQAVLDLGDGLIATGRADDGVIEAVEVPDAGALGVQWHPELMPQVAARLFSWLIDRACEHGAELATHRARAAQKN